MILSNIMFHAPKGRFQLELFVFITYFSTVVPFNGVFSFLQGKKKNTHTHTHNIEWDDGGKIGNKINNFILNDVKKVFPLSS